jgi:hypothetical protein
MVEAFSPLEAFNRVLAGPTRDGRPGQSVSCS